MRKIILILLFVLFLYNYSIAGNTAQQTFTWQILPINEIWVSGDPPTLVINTAQAGYPPEEAVDSSTTYSVVTNEGAYVTPEKPKKITGQINQNMPANTYLKVNLSPPAEAETMGDVELGITAQTLVDYIVVPDLNLTITYRFGASAEAGVLNGIRVVIFTLTDSV